MVKSIIFFFKWLFGEKCEFCHCMLRKGDDQYYGGIEIKDTIDGKKKGRTAYVCNLCYQFLKKIND